MTKISLWGMVSFLVSISNYLKSSIEDKLELILASKSLRWVYNSVNLGSLVKVPIVDVIKVFLGLHPQNAPITIDVNVIYY